MDKLKGPFVTRSYKQLLENTVEGNGPSPFVLSYYDELSTPQWLGRSRQGMMTSCPDITGITHHPSPVIIVGMADMEDGELYVENTVEMKHRLVSRVVGIYGSAFVAKRASPDV